MINELAGAMYTRLSGGTALTDLLASTPSIYHGRVQMVRRSLMLYSTCRVAAMKTLSPAG